MSKRDEVVAEAKTWLLTPWHHEARIKGVGVDCAQFLIGVYHAVGLVPDIQTGHYPRDWHLHKEQPRFLEFLLEYTDPVEVPEIGDVAMFQYGRQSAHGGIVISDNVIIHAWMDEGRVITTDLAHSPLAQRLTGYYRVRGIA